MKVPGIDQSNIDSLLTLVDLISDGETDQPEIMCEKLQDSTWELDGGGSLTFREGIRFVDIEFSDDWHCALDLLLQSWDESKNTLHYDGDTNRWENWWDTFAAELSMKYLPESDTIRGFINVEPYQPYFGDHDGSMGSFTAKRNLTSYNEATEESKAPTEDCADDSNNASADSKPLARRSDGDDGHSDES